MQPWHLRIIAEAEAEKRTEAQKQDIVQAWYVAAFSRTEKLPKLASLFKEKPSKKSVDSDIIKFMKNYKASYGARNKN